MEWFRSNNVHVLERHSQSPDLNPIEHLSQDLKVGVHRSYQKFQSLDVQRW